MLLAELTFSFICYSLYVTIEYSPEWRDFIGVFGTLATLLAFAIAIKQVGDARRAAEASEAAVKKTVQVYGSQYFTYAISEAKKLFNLGRSHQIQARNNNVQHWPIAAEYFRMTAEVLRSARDISPAAFAPNIQPVVDALREHSGECDRMGGGGQNFKQAKWNELDEAFSVLMFELLRPFPQQVPHANDQ